MMGGMAGLLLAILLSALAPECRKCADLGLAPCPELKAHACTGAAARVCAVAARCAECIGTGTVPCAKCGRAPEAGHAAARAEGAAFLAEMAPIDAEFGRPLAHARSAHFLLTFDVEGLDVKGGATRHDGLHLYLERLEELHARFAADLGVREEDWLGPTHVLLWHSKEDQEKAALAYTRQSSSTESKLMGHSPVVTIFYDEAWLHEEFELHQAVAHQVAHCLLSNAWDGIWPGNIRGGWLDEGLAHAYELELFGEVRHYCYVESDTILDLQRGSWEPPVRALVDAGETAGFLGVAGKNTTELTEEEQLLAWSYVDYLRRAHPAQLGPIARGVKAKQPIKDVLAATLAMTPFQFEEVWREWVKATYALKEKKRRR
jgi:hypothetical protein